MSEAKKKKKEKHKEEIAIKKNGFGHRLLIESIFFSFHSFLSISPLLNALCGKQQGKSCRKSTALT